MIRRLSPSANLGFAGYPDAKEHPHGPPHRILGLQPHRRAARDPRGHRRPVQAVRQRVLAREGRHARLPRGVRRRPLRRRLDEHADPRGVRRRRRRHPRRRSGAGADRAQRLPRRRRPRRHVHDGRAAAPRHRTSRSRVPARRSPRANCACSPSASPSPTPAPTPPASAPSPCATATSTSSTATRSSSPASSTPTCCCCSPARRSARTRPSPRDGFTVLLVDLRKAIEDGTIVATPIRTMVNHETNELAIREPPRAGGEPHRRGGQGLQGHPLGHELRARHRDLASTSAPASTCSTAPSSTPTSARSSAARSARTRACSSRIAQAYAEPAGRLAHALARRRDVRVGREPPLRGQRREAARLAGAVAGRAGGLRHLRRLRGR